MAAPTNNVQYVDGTLFRGGVDIGDEINKAYAALNTAVATTAASLTSNVVTLTLAVNPSTFGFASGQIVYVGGFTGSDTYLNGSATLTGVTSTTVTYSLTHANATATTNGSVSFASGGTIYVAPETNGAAYSFQTPILFGVRGKYVALKGLVPANQNNLAGTANSMGGVTLNWAGTSGGTSLSLTGVTGTSADSGIAVYAGTITGGGSNALAGKLFQVTGFPTNASNNGYFVCTASTISTLTLANGLAVTETHAATAQVPTTAMTWANDFSGGDGYAVANSMEDICLVNAAYSGLNNGGNGYCTIGLDFTRAGRLQSRNVRIGGFGVGKVCIQSVNWGAKDYNHTLAWNNVGLIFHNCQEDYGWFGGQLAVNGIGIQTSGTLAAGGDIHLFNVSIDSHTIYGVLGFSGLAVDFGFYGCHFENLAATPITTHYLYVQPSIGSENFTSVAIVGGEALDDASSGTADWWFNIGSGSSNPCYLTVTGLQVSSFNRGATVFQIGNGSSAYLQGLNSTPTTFTGGHTLTVYSGNNVTSLFNTQNPFVFQNGIQVQGGISTTTGLFTGTTTYVTTGSFANIGITTNSSVFTLRDDHFGGTVNVTVDNVGNPVLFGATAGGTTFVVGTPGANQIGVQYSGGFLQVQGNGTRIGINLKYQQSFLS